MAGTSFLASTLGVSFDSHFTVQVDEHNVTSNWPTRAILIYQREGFTVSHIGAKLGADLKCHPGWTTHPLGQSGTLCSKHASHDLADFKTSPKCYCSHVQK